MKLELGIEKPKALTQKWEVSMIYFLGWNM